MYNCMYTYVRIYKILILVSVQELCFAENTRAHPLVHPFGVDLHLYFSLLFAMRTCARDDTFGSSSYYN